MRTPTFQQCISSDFEQPLNIHNNFTKRIRASPDGLCVLVSSADMKIRLYETPPSSSSSSSILESETTTESNNIKITESMASDINNNTIPEPTAIYTTHEGGCVYDMEWNPLMNSNNPSSCFYTTAVQGHPIHLYDAYSGHFCASYRPYNDLDELDSTFSITFSADGNKIISGHERCIRIFDTQSPGRTYSTRKLTSTRKSKRGQKGIIASLDCNPDHSGLFAAGSYNGTTCLYAESSPEELMQIQGHDGCGITQVQFSKDGTFLFTAARNDYYINCWDIRNTSECIMQYKRNAKTNQRIGFDLQNDGKVICTGNKEAKMMFYNVQSGQLLHTMTDFPGT